MRRPTDYPEAAQVLSRWAGMLEPARARAALGAAAWGAVELLVRAGRGWVESEARDLEDLLRQSDTLLAPFGDPLETDLGAHRWLEGQREENYSDWLAWVLRQIPAAERLFRLLGLPLPASLALWGAGTPRITRELPFEAGRLDIVIRYPDRALIVVEVKCPGGEADYGAQLKRYGESLEGQSELCRKYLVLVTTQEGPSSLSGLHVRPWRQIACELRHLGCELRAANQWCAAAMTLAFAGAVEQNLLGLPSRPMAGIRSGRVWDVGKAVSHLMAFLAHVEGAWKR